MQCMKPTPNDMLRPKNTQNSAVIDMATLSLTQVVQLSGVGEVELQGLADYSVLTPISPGREPWTFDIECVTTLQRAVQLRQDLALDSHAFALAVMFLNQITSLEAELRDARSELRRFHAGGSTDH